jgi:hypothetical protein
MHAMISGEHCSLLCGQISTQKVAQFNIPSEKYIFPSNKMHIFITRADNERKCQVVFCAFWRKNEHRAFEKHIKTGFL